MVVEAERSRWSKRSIGLSPFAFEGKFLRQVLQRCVRHLWFETCGSYRELPRNTRAKGWGFITRGFTRLSRNDEQCRHMDVARQNERCNVIIDNQSKGYSGSLLRHPLRLCIEYGVPAEGIKTIVWTSTIGHAFINRYKLLEGSNGYGWLSALANICVSDNQTYHHENGLYLHGYVP